MKQIRPLLLLSLVLALFCQCSGHRDADGLGSLSSLDDASYAAIDSCMAYMDSDPARAHHMLDSVHDAGVISRQRCDMMHAMVLFSGEAQTDSALAICNDLLNHGDFADDSTLEAEVCELATNIAASCHRYIEVLKYAGRGIPLCHGRESLCSEEAAMLGRAGTAHQILGHLDEARQTNERALALLGEDTSFGGFISRISLQKKQAGLFREMGDYDGMIAVCHQILAQVDRFDRDPSFVEPRPLTMTVSGEATHGFADFYQTQMYVRLAGAFRMKVEHGMSLQPNADRDSASAYIDKWLQTSGSQSAPNMATALRELYFTGHRSAFLAAKRVVGEAFGSDTLSRDYHDYLMLMAEDAALRHDLAGSNSFLLRAAAVNDSLHRQELLSTFAEQVSLHMVQEAQLAQQDAELQLTKHRMFLLVMGLMLVAAVVIIILLHKANQKARIVASLQQNLQESEDVIDSLNQQLEECKSEAILDTSLPLYDRIVQAMSEQKLYLNPDLDILVLTDAVKSCRTSVSGCIKATSGKPFRIWLSEYRLQLFVDMLKEDPEASIDDLAIQCGYKDQSTFRRQFKATYGMTASQYRRLQLEGKQGTSS